MLIFRYLLRETVKAQAAVFLVLMAIFMTQKFVRVLADATSGDIPVGLIVGFLSLKFPALATLILPLSLFLGIMLAHGRLYVDSEMTVMRACGISEWYVTRVMLVLAVLMAFISAGLSLWLTPMAIEKEYQLKEQAVTESGLNSLIPGRFQETANRQAVMFVHDIGADDTQLEGVFVAQRKDKPTKQGVHVVYAKHGNVVESADGSQKLVLIEGRQYEGQDGKLNYNIVEFDQYQVQIAEQQAEHKKRKLAAYPTEQLLNDNSLDAMAELQWRLALPFAIPFLILIAVPLSSVDPRQGRFGKMFPGLLLYLGYFLLLIAGRKALESGKIPPQLGLWWIHLVMLLVGAFLIVKGRPLGVRVRAWVKGTASD